jgi:hypothetical protein
MSIQKMARGPMMLMDKVFNIPIFSANNQEYICTEVADLGSDAISKTYGVYFKWIPSSYSVPEVLRMDVIINNGSNHIEIQLFEKRNSGSYIPLYHRGYGRERISSVANIQNMIQELIGQ